MECFEFVMSCSLGTITKTNWVVFSNLSTFCNLIECVFCLFFKWWDTIDTIVCICLCSLTKYYVLQKEWLCGEIPTGNTCKVRNSLTLKVTLPVVHAVSFYNHNILKEIKVVLQNKRGPVDIAKDYYIDGQNTELIFFEKITTEGGNGTANYALGMDFLDHDLL